MAYASNNPLICLTIHSYVHFTCDMNQYTFSKIVVQLSQILGPELIGIVSLNDNDDDTVSEGSSNSSIGELENNNQRDEIVLA